MNYEEERAEEELQIRYDDYIEWIDDERKFTFYKYQQFMPNRWRVVEEIPYLPEGGVLGIYQEKIIKRFWFKKNAESYCFQLQLGATNDN